MIKYYLKSDGQEVKIGETIQVSTRTNTPFGVGTTTLHVVMSQDTIPLLLEHEVIEKRETSNKGLRFYVRKVARRFNMSYPEAAEMLDNFIEKEPVVALTMLLKEMSLNMNKDISISRLPKVYVISTINGEICEVLKEDIRSYDHFAAFKSKEQAQEAYNLLKDLLTRMYGK